MGFFSRMKYDGEDKETTTKPIKDEQEDSGIESKEELGEENSVENIFTEEDDITPEDIHEAKEADTKEDANTLDSSSDESLDNDIVGHPMDIDADNSVTTATASGGSIDKQVKEMKDITKKIQTVKEEYDMLIISLMTVKKDLNEQRAEKDMLENKCNVLKLKVAESKETDKKDAASLEKKKREVATIEDKIKQAELKYKEITENIAKEQHMLSIIIKQQTQVKKELDEAESRLYNANEELNRKERFEDTSILTPQEKGIIQDTVTDVGPDKKGHNVRSYASVIEAASTVVGSLKSKLTKTQKELETVQTLLEKERDEHAKTRQTLDEFLQKNQ